MVYYEELFEILDTITSWHIIRLKWDLYLLEDLTKNEIIWFELTNKWTLKLSKFESSLEDIKLNKMNKLDKKIKVKKIWEFNNSIDFINSLVKHWFIDEEVKRTLTFDKFYWPLELFIDPNGKNSNTTLDRLTEAWIRSFKSLTFLTELEVLSIKWIWKTQLDLIKKSLHNKKLTFKKLINN